MAAFAYDGVAVFGVEDAGRRGKSVDLVEERGRIAVKVEDIGRVLSNEVGETSSRNPGEARGEVERVEKLGGRSGDFAPGSGEERNAVGGVDRPMRGVGDGIHVSLGASGMAVPKEVKDREGAGRSDSGGAV